MRASASRVRSTCVLVQVHPDTGISTKSMAILDK